jgi:hypothetical protein
MGVGAGRDAGWAVALLDWPGLSGLPQGHFKIFPADQLAGSFRRLPQAEQLTILPAPGVVEDALTWRFGCETEDAECDGPECGTFTSALHEHRACLPAAVSGTCKRLEQAWQVSCIINLPLTMDQPFKCREHLTHAPRNIDKENSWCPVLTVQIPTFSCFNRNRKARLTLFTMKRIVAVPFLEQGDSRSLSFRTISVSPLQTITRR